MRELRDLKDLTMHDVQTKRHARLYPASPPPSFRPSNVCTSCKWGAFGHRGTGEGGGGSSCLRDDSRSRAIHRSVGLCTCIYDLPHTRGFWSLNRFSIATSPPHAKQRRKRQRLRRNQDRGWRKRRLPRVITSHDAPGRCRLLRGLCPIPVREIRRWRQPSSSGYVCRSEERHGKAVI